MNAATSAPTNLHSCLARLAQLQHETVDRLALQEAIQTVLTTVSQQAPQEQLSSIAKHLQVAAPRWLAAPDAAVMPSLIYARNGEHAGQWGILLAKNAKHQWMSVWFDESANCWREKVHDDLDTVNTYVLAAFKLSNPAISKTSADPVYQLIRQEIFSHKKLIRDVVIGGVVINITAMTTSFYSMQVYDRVVPTGAVQTLLVLTLGVFAAIIFELVARQLRSGLYEKLIDQVDQRLARAMYMRFLSIRMDQLPQSVGGLASQMRGYETVRSFLTSITTNLLVDAPFALFFTLVIASIAGWLALIPLGFFLLSIAMGWYYHQRIETCATHATLANNQKSGLLVETIEGAEIIKSGQGGWRMLSRWMQTTDKARENELQMRSISEHAQHLSTSFQQLSYIILVASGALLVGKAELSMGGLIACSILSGRVLSPIATIPTQLMQWAHAKAALVGLAKLWSLQDDHHGQEQAISIDNIRGQYQLESVGAYYGSNKALSVSSLSIQPGEKVGVLGPVGAGKTTLLRLLSGMYKPQEGRILLDDIDLAHIAKPTLAERMAYVAQDGRMFSGTLRENLILGQIDPGDEVILQVARQTGLLQAVIAQHPKGLQQPIFEGGTGLSGGQRQLVNLTRALLRKPSIWLLDEPTASMDRNLELHIMSTLKQAIKPQDTLILVTHKAEMLELIDRLIVIAHHQIVLDGPKSQVLQKLQNTPQPIQQIQEISGQEGAA